MFYLLVGYRRLRRDRRRKPDPARKIRALSEPSENRFGDLEMLDPELRRTSRLSAELTDFPVVGGNTVTLFADALTTYGAIADAIAGAQDHVYMQYYIFQPDDTGREFRELLVNKARQGVKCRVLVDAVGSFRLSRRFIEPMLQVGIEFARFWPLRLSRPWGFHLRNHRKLVVVDNAVGFAGSQNIGDEYVNWNHRNLSWRDMHIRIEGPAVEQLQIIFQEDWEFTTGRPAIISAVDWNLRTTGTSHIQILPTGPDDDPRAPLELVLSMLLYSAAERITIVTPYFVPTLPIVMALEAAAARGVDVEILVPKRSNHWIADWAARSWYRDITAAGVKLYEFAETFVHAKLVTIDERMCLVGSANMDQRSFQLNFECSVLLYDESVTKKLVRNFEGMARESDILKLDEIERQPYWRQVWDGAFRLLSPLL